MSNSSFFLWGNCILTYGYKNSLIIDLQNNNQISIFNEFIEKNNKSKRIKKIIHNYLIKNSFGYISKENLNYRPISLEWNYPFHISQLTVEIFDIHNIEILIKKITNYNIDCILFEFIDYNFNYIKKCIKIIQSNKIQSIQLNFKNLNNIHVKKILQVFMNYNLTHIYINNSFNSIEQIQNTLIINYDKIPEINFIINRLFFTESIKFNPSFNRKFFIDNKLNIKNHKNDSKSDFNINSINGSLLNLSNNKLFTQLWYANKTKIRICKNCEFKNICSDSRLPIHTKNNNWYYNSECNYNPYIAKWKDEDGYKTLAECGVISNENGFSIDHDKIAEINKVLWGE